VKHREKNVLLVALAVVVLFMANQAGFLGPRIPIPGLTQLQQPAPPPPPPGPIYTEGIITTDVAAFDSLDIATSRTVGTNVNVYWYAQRNGQWVLLGSGDAADINAEERDRDIIYAVASVPSGQDYYVDYQKILSMNSRAQSMEYKDIDGDNVEEWAFRLDIADIPFASGTGKYSLPSFNVYLLTYDTSPTWPTAGRPGDHTGAGTTKVTKYLEWYTAASAEKKATALSKVVLAVNTSDISKVALKKLNIPGVGYLDGSSFDQDVLTSSIKWTYTISNLLYGADYIKLPVNTMNKFEFTTAVELDLASGDVLQFTLTIYHLDPTESQQSASDSVNVSA